MSAKKGNAKLQEISWKLAKILLLLILYLLVLGVPLLAKDMVTTAFTGFDANTPFDATYVPNYVYSLLFSGFAIFIGALFVVNMVFRLIDERMNDTVVWRRVVQVMLNILILIGGALYLLYLTYGQIPLSDWWSYSDFAAGSDTGNILYWGGAALYLVCAAILSFFDLRVFAAESRSPLYRKNRMKRHSH